MYFLIHQKKRPFYVDEGKYCLFARPDKDAVRQGGFSLISSYYLLKQNYQQK